MKFYLLLCTVVLLSGCDGFPFGMDRADPSNITFVGAGQSNMAGENLAETFPNSVNVALGATHITDWQKGTTLYQAMLTASQHQPAVILWWQGESEGIDGFPHGDWKVLFLQMVSDLRSDLHVQIPFIVVQIGQTNRVAPYWEQVQDEQASLAILPHFQVVTARDMYPQLDGIHYTDDQYRIVQKRMLDAFYALK